MDPEVAVIDTVEVPVAAAGDTAKARVELALPPEGGVRGLAEKEAVTPVGRPRRSGWSQR
jgi:hypothetical protein